MAGRESFRSLQEIWRALIYFLHRCLVSFKLVLLTCLRFELCTLTELSQSYIITRENVLHNIICNYCAPVCRKTKDRNVKTLSRWRVVLAKRQQRETAPKRYFFVFSVLRLLATTTRKGAMAHISHNDLWIKLQMKRVIWPPSQDLIYKAVNLSHIPWNEPLPKSIRSNKHIVWR